MHTMRKIEKIIAAISGFSLTIVFIVAFAQVIQRYFFNMPIPWATDVIRICFIYSVFGGMCVGVINKSHLNIDVVVNLLNPKIRNIFLLMSNTMVIVFLIIVLRYSITFIIANNDQYTPYLSFPMSYVYIVFPITSLIMIVALLLDNRDALFGKKGTNEDVGKVA